MATSTFLFDHDVRLVAITGEKTAGGLNMSSFVQPKEIKESSGGSIKSFLDRLEFLAEESDEEDEEAEQQNRLVGWVRKGLVRVTVDEPTSPLDILTVSLHLPATPGEIACHIEGVTVVGAHRQFLVLSTGPRLGDFASSGHYLVYDRKEEKLHLLPPINLGEFREDFGRVPVITATAANNFLLALVLFSRYTKKHSLFIFTEGNDNDNWVRKEVCLPKVVTEYWFNTDVAFSIHGSLACWADLTLGIILCDLHSEDNPCVVRFVPLPEDYQIDSCYRMSRGRPNAYCTLGFVDGSIRLVFMDGYNDEEFPRDKVTISTWSYKGGFLLGEEPDHKGEWVRDHGAPLRVTDLWADASFRAIPGVPRRPPMCPVLSQSDPDVVFFFTSDIGYVDGHIATRGEHALCLNMRSKKVQAWRKCPPGRSHELIPFLIGIELSVDPRVSDMDDQLVASQL
ncbi:unnamed protein product [Urochloa decumbens]|uniref:DUF1618 domain-containing protein n=1 Tax=Urochloa decumbens TaxID=240449 RepID=A0ABC8YC98_9POAL